MHIEIEIIRLDTFGVSFAHFASTFATLAIWHNNAEENLFEFLSNHWYYHCTMRKETQKTFFAVYIFSATARVRNGVAVMLITKS